MRINRFAAERVSPYTPVVEGLEGECLTPLHIQNNQQTELSEMRF
jgi:hypothetical protein